MKQSKKSEAGVRLSAASFERSAIDEVAADWMARRDAGMTAEEHKDFVRWLAADERHAAAIAEIEAAWAMINAPRMAGRSGQALLELSMRKKRRLKKRRRNALAFATVGLAAAAAVVMAWLPRSETHEAMSIAAAGISQSISLRPERRALADGSVIEMGAGANIVVEFSSDSRRVRLLRGTAHFSVAKDEARPFAVTIAAVEVRAVGTEFAVAFAPEKVEVCVNEGRVTVGRTDESTGAGDSTRQGSAVAPVLAEAGDRVIVPFANGRPEAPRLDRMTPAQLEHALAWRGQRAEFSGTPLAEALALFNRQNRLQLAVADTSVGALRVSGIYWADNPEGFARLIATTFRLQAVRVADDRIEFRK